MSDDLIDLIEKLRDAIYLAEDGNDDYTTPALAAKVLQAQASRIAELEAALRKVAEWERLLGLADSWITAAIECKEWRWDADQHEAATLTRDEIRAALEGGK